MFQDEEAIKREIRIEARRLGIDLERRDRYGNRCPDDLKRLVHIFPQEWREEAASECTDSAWSGDDVLALMIGSLLDLPDLN